MSLKCHLFHLRTMSDCKIKLKHQRDSTDALDIRGTGHAILAHWGSKTQALLFPVSCFLFPLRLSEAIAFITLALQAFRIGYLLKGKECVCV